MTTRAQRILILEDEAIVGLVIKQALQRAGFEDVRHVLTVDDAKQELARGDVTLCIFDIMLEQGTSAGAVAEANRQKIPVVLNSGNTDLRDLTVLPDNFIFLSKPTPPEILENAVCQILGLTGADRCA